MGRVLLTLSHLCTLCPIAAAHPTCVFPSLANYTHKIDPASDMLLVSLQLHEEFITLGISMQPTKCVA